MKEISIEKLSVLDDEYKDKALDLFVDGFGHIYSFIKDKNVLKGFIKDSMDFSMTYVALYQGNVVGFIGVSDNKKRLISFELEKFKNLFGEIMGVIIQKPISLTMEKPGVKGDKDLYIEYLTTDDRYRGRGVASELVEFVCAQLDYDDCYIEVLSKNYSAIKLYKRLGFVEHKRVYDISTLIRGLGYLIKFKKQIRDKKSVFLD